MNEFDRYSNAAYLREILRGPDEPIAPGQPVMPAAKTPASPDTLLTEERAAEIAGVSRKTISKLIKSGRLEAVDYGTGGKHLYRIRVESLAALQAPPKESAPSPRQRKRRAPLPGDVKCWLPRV